MKIKIKKIGKCEKPLHPDSDYGNSQEYFEGIALHIPKVGQCFSLYPSEKSPKGIRTSIVKKVEEDTFETLNSIYSWEIIEA